jgi:hypothetical protein
MISALARIASFTPYEQSNKHVEELRENNSASHAINKVTHENKQPKSKKFIFTE